MQFRPTAPLYFIRHGETDWNIERRFQGQSDIALNENGKEQARTNGKILARLLNFNAGAAQSFDFISSPLSRASQTTQILIKELEMPEAEYKTDIALQEISFGLWEGLTSAEAKQQYYEARQKRRKDRWAIAPPGGESFAERVLGVEQFLASLTTPSIVVSHSGIMRIILHLLQRLAPQEAVNSDIPHIGIHIWDGNSLIFAGK